MYGALKGSLGALWEHLWRLLEAPGARLGSLGAGGVWEENHAKTCVFSVVNETRKSGNFVREGRTWVFTAPAHKSCPTLERTESGPFRRKDRIVIYSYLSNLLVTELRYNRVPEANIVLQFTDV